MADFLIIANLLRATDPEHPAAALYDYYTSGPGSRLRLARLEAAE